MKDVSVLTYSQNLIDFIKKFEGLSLQAYDDSCGVATIGWGCIEYPSGENVQMNDTCTIEEAQQWLEWEVEMKAKSVKQLVGAYPITQNQFDAFVSFAYNLGSDALAHSTLLRKFKANPNDETIYKYEVDKDNKPIADSCEFLRWVRGNGKVLKGLCRRRAAEANMYANADSSNATEPNTFL